ncbi:MAG: sterol desaturase family protein [Bradymonadia bacterium]
MTERNDDYQYRERQIDNMADRALLPGTGRISGYASCFLGIISFFGALCFKYPEYLTTRELREVYNPYVLQDVLKWAMWTALALGVYTFIQGRRRRLGAIGIGGTLLAFALGGYTISPRAVTPTEVSLGLDWFVLDLMISAAVFVCIEKIWPKYKEQAVLRPEWRTDLIYFGVNHLLIAILLLAANGFAPKFFSWAINSDVRGFMHSMPIWGQALVMALCADFVLYWSHRFFHEVPALWKFHAVHHCTEHMDWLAGSRNHPVQMFVDRCAAMVPLYLLGGQKEALDLYVTLAAFQAVFVHANVGIPFGPLKYVIATPQFHHWHHSSEKPAIDTNYAVHFPLFDYLFGTAHMPDENWPAEYGTTKRLPRTFWPQLLYPFRKSEPE